MFDSGLCNNTTHRWDVMTETAGCTGLTVFAIGPSTLAQGQTLVRQAGGNTTLALMLLVMTNTIAVFIAPFLIKAMLASQAAGVKLDSAHLLINLVITVLAPSIVGKARDPSYHRCLCCTSLPFQPLVRWGLKLIQKTP